MYSEEPACDCPRVSVMYDINVALISSISCSNKRARTQPEALSSSSKSICCFLTDTRTTSGYTLDAEVGHIEECAGSVVVDIAHIAHKPVHSAKTHTGCSIAAFWSMTCRAWCREISTSSQFLSFFQNNACTLLHLQKIGTTSRIGPH